MDLQGLRLTWYGHSTFRIETASGKHVVIDPWFKENPPAQPNKKPLKPLKVMLTTNGNSTKRGAAAKAPKKKNPTGTPLNKTCPGRKKKGVENCSGMNR